MSHGAFTMADVDQASAPVQKGQFSTSDLDVHPDVPENHWLAAAGDKLKDLASGYGAGALQSITAVSRGLNKIPVIGETLAPTAGVNAMRIAATPDNTTQRVGAAMQQATELMLPTPGKIGLGAKMLLGGLEGGASTYAHEAGTTAEANPTDVAIGTGLGAAAPAVEGAAHELLNSKFSRGLVNESVMATAKDVTYGNPAKALLDEGIATPRTGDIEKFKDAIRSGATLQGASEAAGGRIAAISDKINELGPKLRTVLSKSTQRIPATTVTDTIDAGIKAIKADRGVTAEEATAAIHELEAMRDAALKIPAAPGATAKAWAPLEANALKQEIGQSVNWSGRERVGQLVEPVKKKVYGSLKDAVNAAAPGSAELNERLTNLHAAQEDVNKLAGFEEVGRGRSSGGVIGPSWMGRVEALAGRYIPALSWLTPTISPAIKSTAIPAVTASGSPQ